VALFAFYSQAINHSASPHSAEVFVVLHLGVQDDRLANCLIAQKYFDSSKPIVGNGVERV
jgi:hypothetical protein